MSLPFCSAETDGPYVQPRYTVSTRQERSRAGPLGADPSAMVEQYAQHHQATQGAPTHPQQLSAKGRPPPARCWMYHRAAAGDSKGCALGDVRHLEPRVWSRL